MSTKKIQQGDGSVNIAETINAAIAEIRGGKPGANALWLEAHHIKITVG